MSWAWSARLTGMTRRIVLPMNVSTDGFFEGLGGDIGWHRVDDELHQYFNDQLRDLAGFLNGRVIYELMAEFWPTADNDPQSSAPMREFAAIWTNRSALSGGSSAAEALRRLT
jgi:dihydrofolate reductase